MKNSIPTLDLGLEPAEEGRSVGSLRPKIFFAALGRSVFTESETQNLIFLGRSVGDAKCWEIKLSLLPKTRAASLTPMHFCLLTADVL